MVVVWRAAARGWGARQEPPSNSNSNSADCLTPRRPASRSPCPVPLSVSPCGAASSASPRDRTSTIRHRSARADPCTRSSRARTSRQRHRQEQQHQPHHQPRQHSVHLRAHLDPLRMTPRQPLHSRPARSRRAAQLDRRRLGRLIRRCRRWPSSRPVPTSSLHSIPSPSGSTAASQSCE